MSLFMARGGFPRVTRHTVTTTGRRYPTDPTGPTPQVCFHLKIRVLTFPVKVYFTEKDYDDDVNYLLIPVPAAATPWGEWEGPAEIKELWMKGVGGSAEVELCPFLRLN